MTNRLIEYNQKLRDEYDGQYQKLRDELDEVVRLYLKGEGIDFLFSEVPKIEKKFIALRKTFSR